MFRQHGLYFIWAGCDSLYFSLLYPTSASRCHTEQDPPPQNSLLYIWRFVSCSQWHFLGIDISVSFFFVLFLCTVSSSVTEAIFILAHFFYTSFTVCVFVIKMIPGPPLIYYLLFLIYVQCIHLSIIVFSFFSLFQPVTLHSHIVFPAKVHESFSVICC